MDGFDVFRKYLGISLHFRKGDYDYFKYGSKFTKIGRNAYEDRKDKFWFELAAEKIPSVTIDFMLASIFFERPKSWIRDILTDECQEIYRRRNGIRESLDYHFENDLRSAKNELERANISFHDAIVDAENPFLFRLYRYKTIQAETLIILDKIFGVFAKWDGRIKDSIIYPRERDNLKKYAPFLGTINKTKKVEKIKEMYVNRSIA